MFYCISDVHGNQDRFHALLELIGFNDRDTLYIIGDVIDRGPGSVALLRGIMSAPNMVMLLGNHEQMCLDTLGPHNVVGSRELWKQNGGGNTYRELLYICTPSERMEILRFLRSLPDHLELEVSGRAFHLVHGYPAGEREERIWGRPIPDAPPPFPDRLTVVGHTPVNFLAKQDGPYTIWHGNGILDIDCGLAGKSENRRLGCLRLDDMREFYV